MIHFHPAVPIGTVSAESVRILGTVPDESRGILIQGMDVFLASAQPIGLTDYWVFELGTLLTTASFETRSLYALPQTGMCKGRNAIEFQRKVRYDTGEVVAVRVRPIGAPGSLTGCDVVLKIQEP